MNNYDIDAQQLIDVPKHIAKCPYCGDELVIIHVDKWSYDDDHRITPEHIELECAGAPVFDGSQESELAEQGHLKIHTESPYVYWLPVEEKVLTWFKGAYDFVRASHEKELLEKWVKAATGKNE